MVKITGLVSNDVVRAPSGNCWRVTVTKVEGKPVEHVIGHQFPNATLRMIDGGYNATIMLDQKALDSMELVMESNLREEKL